MSSSSSMAFPVLNGFSFSPHFIASRLSKLLNSILSYSGHCECSRKTLIHRRMESLLLESYFAY